MPRSAWMRESGRAGLTAMIAGLAPRARYFLVATRKYPKKRSPVTRRAKNARFPALLRGKTDPTTLLYITMN